MDEEGKNIWDTFGRWDELAQLKDVADVKAAISGRDLFVPNYASSATQYVFKYANDEVTLSDAPVSPTIVDFGCGLGRNGPLLRQHFPRVVGYDLPQMMERMRAEDPDLAASVYDDLYTSPDALVANEPFCALYDSVALQHIVDFDFHKSFLTTLEANPRFRTIITLYFKTSSGVPAHIDVLNERGWTLWHSEEDVLSFRGIPHNAAVYRRPDDRQAI
jgi:hypothetical protein